MTCFFRSHGSPFTVPRCSPESIKADPSHAVGRQNNPTLIEILAEADQASQSFLATAKSCCLEYLAKIASEPQAQVLRPAILAMKHEPALCKFELFASRSDVGDIALDMRDAWVQNSAPRSSASWERATCPQCPLGNSHRGITFFSCGPGDG